MVTEPFMREEMAEDDRIMRDACANVAWPLPPGVPFLRSAKRGAARRFREAECFR